MKRQVFSLVFLLLLVLAVPTLGVQAQGGGGGIQFPDSDGDGVPDEFDGCPTDAGLSENYGCPAGVTVPDTDGDSLPDVADGCREIVGSPDMGGCPDTDGDQIPENSDACPAEPGLSQNSGCPLGVVADLDQDGVPDREDVCFNRAGTPDLAGCPPEYTADTDADGVTDFLDACVNEAGEVGNAGCPSGINPDSDYDGVIDAQDACPRQYGSADNSGCLKDTDGDLIEDQYDACPDQPGDGRNSGCPDGTAPPDTDADAVPDIYDRCPAEAGANGIDCPDRDGDFVADIDDQCPDDPGDTSLQGCAAVVETALPQNRTPINAQNVGNLALMGSLRVGVTQIAAAASSPTLAVQTFTSGLLIYNLGATPITPQPLESQTGIIDINADGTRLVDTLFDSATGQPAFTVWDTTTANGVQFVPIGADNFINQVAISPDGSLVATAHGFFSPFGEPVPEGSTFSVRLWDVASGQQTAELGTEAGVTQVAFSPDGSKLAAGTDGGTTLFDLASGQPLATLGATPMFTGSGLAFSPDGTKLAVGHMGGTISVWDTTSFAQVYEVQAFDSSQFNQAVLAVAFSPDGSLLAVAGGPFVDGPPLEEFNFQVIVLNAADGTPIKALENLTSAPNSLSFSSDGTLLIFNVANEVQFWGVSQ